MKTLEIALLDQPLCGPYDVHTESVHSLPILLSQAPQFVAMAVLHTCVYNVNVALEVSGLTLLVMGEHDQMRSLPAGFQHVFVLIKVHMHHQHDLPRSLVMYLWGKKSLVKLENLYNDKI